MLLYSNNTSLIFFLSAAIAFRNDDLCLLDAKSKHQILHFNSFIIKILHTVNAYSFMYAQNT